MDTETALQKAESILSPWTRWSKRTQPHVVEISVSRHNLLDCVRALQTEKWGYLATITGLHVPGVETTTTEEKQWTRLTTDNIHTQPAALGDSFIILYHFCEGGAVLNLRVHPPSLNDNAVPSVCPLIPSASIYERELQEMFGVTVENTPDQSHLLLPEDWPADLYPLRKSFTGLPDAPKA